MVQALRREIFGSCRAMQHDARQNKAILARFFPSVDNLYRERGESLPAGRKKGKNGVFSLVVVPAFVVGWVPAEFSGFAGIFGKGWLSLGDTGPFLFLRVGKVGKPFFYVSGNSGNSFYALGKFGK